MIRSLRAELLLWLLLPLAALLAFNLVDTWYRATQTATLVTDRLLLASARVIAEQVHDVDGHVEVAIPPAALEMFASPYQDKIFYQVTAPDGELLAGYPDALAPPDPASRDGFDGRFRIEAVRALSLQQPVATQAQPATVIVASTLHARDAMRTGLWSAAMRDQALIVGLAGVLIVLGLRRGLAPLERTREEVMARDARSLTPVSLDRVQAELRPLLEALNQALDRVAQNVAAQRRFIANAAHQLRTPLAVLKTQAAFGLGDSTLQVKDEVLTAMEAGANGLSRLVHQLLMLARAEPGGGNLSRAVLDAAAPTRAALEQLGTIALDRGIDLTFHADPDATPIDGHVTLLQEMVSNLVGNALNSTPADGRVSVHLTKRGRAAEWVISDTGPGIPVEERGRVFERFYRLPGATYDGTGLGLAVVTEIVHAHDGEIELKDRAGGPGLSVVVRLPLAV